MWAWQVAALHVAVVCLGIGSTQQMATNIRLAPYLGSALFASFVTFFGALLVISAVSLAVRMSASLSSSIKRTPSMRDASTSRPHAWVWWEVSPGLIGVAYTVVTIFSTVRTLALHCAVLHCIALHCVCACVCERVRVRVLCVCLLCLYFCVYLFLIWEMYHVSHIKMYIGLAITFALVVAGQLCAAACVDHTGFLNTPRRRFTPVRVLSLIVAFVGSVLSVSCMSWC